MLCPLSGDLPNPGIEPISPGSSTFAGRFFTHWATWEALFSPLLLLFSCSVMSDCLQPHGRQHAGLPCPSPSPGACSNSCPLSQWCHATICSPAAAAKLLQLCPTLCDPIDGNPPGSPVPGVLQARTLEGLPFPAPMHESEK